MYWKRFIKFGKFVLFNTFSFILFFSLNCYAQKSDSKSEKGAQKGTIIVEVADIYAKDDFDSGVIAQVKKNQVYDISKFPKGAFYKIRLKPGVLGWISDTDVRPGHPIKEGMPAKKKEPEKNSVISKKPFMFRRYWGPAVEMINWTEDTMGKNRTETMTLYGVQWAGYNTVMAGEVYTHASILLSPAAPKYYESNTGNSANGWIYKMNFTFETALPQSPYYLLYFGFGPSFTYSHFDVSLTESGRKVNYSLDDMSIGALFDIGLAFKTGKFSPRFAFKYYWEKKTMTALVATVGWEF